jgi:hypothetical protein
VMTIPIIKGLTVLIRSIREDWDARAVEQAITTLADDGYSPADISAACVEIASDHRNRAPVTLSIKAPELIEKRHVQTARPKAGLKSRDDSYLCDVCGLNEAACQATAGNLNGRDHPFITARAAQTARDQQRADGRLATARTTAVRKAAGGMFQLPKDVQNAHDTAPPPAREESA